jgi:uncharacterized pyridoxamine 5'-phosphate oxidase family protein
MFEKAPSLIDILGVSEDPKFDVLTSGAGAVQVEA